MIGKRIKKMMKSFGHSEKGKRGYQEDRFLIKDNLFVVCDGMGGHPNGDLAAETGIDVMSKINFASKKTKQDLIKDAISIADLKCRLAKDDRGSTLTSVYVDEENKKIVIGHVGDSRAYRISKNGLSHFTIERLTVDHERYGYITSALGFMSKIMLYDSPYQEGERLLIVSDGVSGDYKNNLSLLKAIEKAESNGWNVAEHLCHDAIANGSTDNCTAVYVEL